MEAVRTDEIISRLESVIVPDDPLPVEDEVLTSSQPLVSGPNILSRNEDNAVTSVFSSGEFLAPKGSNRLYPSLDEHFATDVEENQSADHEAESLVEDIQQNKVEASAPDLPMSSSVEGDSDSEFELLTAPDSSGFNIPDDPFYLLLCKYADNWGKWLQALKRLSKVLKESSGMEASAWKISQCNHQKKLTVLPDTLERFPKSMCNCLKLVFGCLVPALSNFTAELRNLYSPVRLHRNLIVGSRHQAIDKEW
ncbi:unnamed protein product [Schistosoma mattheei]|uniref:Uncharacterized protein n=1 Tax=Schistosoma mattheei TaxID=31246 RepID=A0A183NH14_9TREM|nr:unnamed protein product [Schistosoma mattheei]